MPQLLYHVHLEIWLAAGLTPFGLYPALAHLVRGWRIKRDDIFTSLDSDSKRLYLESFQRRSYIGDPDKEFEKFYNGRYGRRNYIFPVLALFIVLIPLCYVMSVTALTQVNVLSPDHDANIFTLLNSTAPYISLPAVAAGGIVGAYLWIVAELIVSMQQLDLAPSDVLRATLRLIIAAPLGYAISSLASPGIAPFIAFAVGAFPLDQIGLALRKVTDRQLNLSIDVGGQPGQVTHLEGIDGPTAERLREANVTTVAQLA